MLGSAPSEVRKKYWQRKKTLERMDSAGRMLNHDEAAATQSQAGATGAASAGTDGEPDVDTLSTLRGRSTRTGKAARQLQELAMLVASP